MTGTPLGFTASEMEVPVPTKKAGSIAILAITVATVIVYEFVLSLLNDESPSAVWAWLAFVGYLSFTCRLVFDAPATSVIMFISLFFSISGVGACAAIESGAWMYEIQQTGYPTGGTARLAVSFIVFFAIGAFIVEPAWKKYRELPIRDQLEIAVSRIALPIAVVCLFVCGYLALVGLRKGFPFFSGNDRFIYRYGISAPIFNSLLGNFNIYAVGTSLLASAPRTRLVGWALFFGMFF